MIRIVDIAGAIDMSRVERNEAIYRENEVAALKSRIITGRILHTVGVTLLVIVLAACLSLFIPKQAGYDGYVVVSGSMEPNLPVGCLVYVEETQPELLRMGDVIVFTDPSRHVDPIAHRVVTNNPFTRIIITKGDANENEDVNPVTYDDVIGKVHNYVPYLGYVASFISSTWGKVCIAVSVFIAWAMTELGARLIRKGKDAKRTAD